MTTSYRLLLVDDDLDLTRRLAAFLTEHGYRVDEACSGRSALEALGREATDLVLLDLGLPDLCGMEVLRGLRRTLEHLPVMILTSKREECDVVLALELGADDFLTKPIRSRELLARVRALLRRANPAADKVLRVDDVVLDRSRRLAFRGGQPLALSSVELDLLAAFLSSPGEVLDRSALLRRAGRAGTRVSERTVDVHVSRLRKKLELDPSHRGPIQTVHGRGYVFVGW